MWPSQHMAPPSWLSLTRRGCACRCTAWRRAGRALAARRCRSRWSPRHVTATTGGQEKASIHPHTATHSTSLLPPQQRPILLVPSLVPSPRLEHSWNRCPSLLRSPDSWHPNVHRAKTPTLEAVWVSWLMATLPCAQQVTVQLGQPPSSLGMCTRTFVPPLWGVSAQVPSNQTTSLLHHESPCHSSRFYD